VRLRRRLGVAIAIGALLALALPVVAAPAALAAPATGPKSGPLGTFKHIVVIYEENHSFDNLYGLWGDVNGQHVEGLDSADAGHTLQIAQDGSTYDCLLQTDLNLRTVNQSPAGPLSETCTDSVLRGDGTTVNISSHFENAPYNIDTYIPATAATCPDRDHLFAFTNGILDGDPNGHPGGCTRDLVHRFYQEQYQLNGGAQNRYVTGSDSAAMSMGYYDTTALPIYQYLHGGGAPKYVVADHFFQAAFGGSFLNHQFLIAAAAPAFNGTHSVLDSAGMPRGEAVNVAPDFCPAGSAGPYPLYGSNTCLVDGNTTQACGLPTTVAGLACGSFGVNTLNPWYQPTGGFATKLPPIDDMTTPMNIGDLMSDAGVSWAYYGGGWDNAAGITDGRGYTNQTDGTLGGSCSNANSVKASVDGDGLNAGWPFCPDKSYQAHHYPFAYFKRYAPGQPDRATHLQDEQDFFWAAANGALPAVSFVKPLGVDNEHPGYASEPNGGNHLLDLIQAIETGPQAGNTLIVVTYDEFGGQWDHVSPPGQGNNSAAHDEWGPGTRIPAILIARNFTRSGVDHTSLDTLSILRTIEAQWHLGDLGQRDADVNSFANAIGIGRPH
jgi:acid phosphatase